MNKNIRSRMMRLISRRELKQHLRNIAMILSCLAVFCITYILIAPVMTEEWPALCGMEEHTHDDSCYEERLVYPEPELICGLEETGHVHDESCYTEVRGDLVCTETDTEESPHEHDDSCYEWIEELTCTESEEGHVHDESCYAVAEPYIERVLVCGLPEHTHTDACYHVPEENPEPEYTCGYRTEHTHDESCYFADGALKCTVPEHTHTDACLVPANREENAAEEPAAGNLVTVAVDDQFTYENEFASITVKVQGDATMRQPMVSRAAEESAAPAEESGFALVVTESEDTTAYSEYEALAEEAGDVMLLQVLNYELTLNGAKLDLSDCEVTVEAVPTQELQEMMEAPQDVGLMTVDAAGEADETDGSNMEYQFNAYTNRPGTVAFSVTQGANVTFYVQYYAWMDRLVTENGTGVALDIIDTSGGKLPKNPEVVPQKVGDPVTYDTVSRNVYVGSDGTLETETTLTEIYKRGEAGKYIPGKGSKFEYFDAPGLQYFNMVSNVTDIQYSINEVWIQKNGQGDPASIDPADWQVFPYEEGVTRFTNRPETVENNANYILLGQNDVIRLIYDPKERDETFQADFYDYDISNGTHAANATSMTVSSGSTNYGINSGGSQSKRFGFGNKNAGTTEALKGAKLNNKYTINARNAVGSWSTGYQNISYGGCTFELVTGMNSAGNDVVFNSNIVGPSLFGASATKGKTSVKDEINQVQFRRTGDTYTLTAIPNTNAQNLDHFHTDSGVWNNSFWPMDSASTWGASGHDIKFGTGTQTFNGTSSKLPTSDDKKLHNAYFGMNFAVDFELTANYIGPLEYYFFGDDDMWVFLSEVTTDANGNKTLSNTQQVIDIGGVHPSVGEYVNLWDYINTDNWSEDTRTAYRLTFFYTERGASGSTCWMQFTLPTVVGVNLESQIEDLIKEDTGTIRIEKQMGGIEGNAPFRFQLGLTGEGTDNYEIEYLYRNADGTITAGKETDAGAAIGNNNIFELEPGEIMVVHNLPASTQYTITELGDYKVGYHTEIHTVVGGSETERVEEFGSEESAVTTGNVTPGQLTSVTFVNIAAYEMPATGGPGTGLWYLTGLCLIAGSVFLLYKTRKRGNASA